MTEKEKMTHAGVGRRVEIKFNGKKTRGTVIRCGMSAFEYETDKGERLWCMRDRYWRFLDG